MTWYHLLDQNSNHYIIPGGVIPVAYFLSQAVDGSQPIYMYLNCGLTFTITPALFTTIVGSVPTAINVTTLGLS
jgi:hypothetical protein